MLSEISENSLWSGVTTMFNFPKEVECGSENVICFQNFLNNIPLGSVVQLTVRSESPFASKVLICRVKHMKYLNSSTKTAVALCPIKPFTASEIVNVSIDRIIPCYRIPMANYVTLYPSTMGTLGDGGTAAPLQLKPCVLQQRLMNTFIHVSDGAVVKANGQQHRFDVCIKSQSEELNASTDSPSLFLITRRTQITVANEPLSMVSGSAESISKENLLGFDIQDELVSLPVLNLASECFSSLPVDSKSVLITGESGCGKTAFVQSLVNKLNLCTNLNVCVELVRITPDEIVAQGREFSDHILKDFLNSCIVRSYMKGIVLLLEDIDVLAPVRTKMNQHTFSEAEKGHEQVLTSFFHFLKEQKLAKRPATDSHLFIFGTAKNKTSVNPRVLNAFTEIVEFKLPTITLRRRALEMLVGVLYDTIASTHESAGERLGLSTVIPEPVAQNLIDSSAGRSMIDCLHLWAPQLTKIIKDRISIRTSENQNNQIASSTTPFLLDGVCGQRHVKDAIQEAIVWPRLHSKIYRQYGIRPPTGLLLFGPPGTGKTLLARNIASHVKGAFISLNLTDILRGHIGVGEQKIRDIFSEAKSSSPSILFIDEFQALFTARAGREQGPAGGDASDTIGASLTSALSLCMDDVCAWNLYAGAEALITVIAATNEPWSVDSGFLRPGRFDKRVYVGPLDKEGRFELLKKGFSLYQVIKTDEPQQIMEEGNVLSESMTREDDLLLEIAESMSDCFTGADLALFIQTVKVAHLKENKEVVFNIMEKRSQITRTGETSVRDNAMIIGPLIPLNLQYILSELEGFEPSTTKRDVDEYLSWFNSR